MSRSFSLTSAHTRFHSYRNSLTTALDPVQSVGDLSWPSSFYSKYRSKFKPNLFVEVYVDQKQVGRSKTAKKTLETKWSKTITIPSAQESSELVMRLKHQSALPHDPCFGIARTTIGQLLRLSEGREVAELQLEHGMKRTMYDAHGFISAGIKVLDIGQARENVLANIRDDLQGQPLESPTPILSISTAVDGLANTMTENEDILQILGAVLEKIKLIADATVGMLDTLSKAYKQQKETDAAVLALFKKMADLYSFVDDVESLPEKIRRLDAVLTRSLEQTAECGMFFREYTSHGFARRLVGQVASNRGQMISELSSTLDQLREDLMSGLVLQTACVSSKTAFVSSQIKTGVDRLVESDNLRGLKPANMDATERITCLPGTRQERLTEIIDWLLTPSYQNVLWLHGEAGVGKSTIATTIADHFGRLGRRGAFLLFDRNSPLESVPSRVISTLAFQLAQQNAAIRSAVSLALDKRPGLVSDPLGAQFQSLLVEPLTAAAAEIEGPIIVVLDALDECGDARSRRILLELLSKDLTKLLPGQLRILITSRPEHDISCALASRSHIHTIDLSTASDADMRVYITHEMRGIYERRHTMDELPEGWGDAAVDVLVGYAAGLFIWAATAMRLLSDADFPKKYLGELLLHDRPFFTLHELYEKALRSASSWEPGDITNVYSGILGLIIISQVPLTDVTIAALLGYQDDVGTCRTALRRLASVIRWSEGQPARTLHKSFPDYLTKHCSSKPWFINVEEHQHTLTTVCLGIMNKRLHFNMCNLTTSHISNEHIPDLSGRVERAIPQSLSYPCLFWGYHVQQTAAGSSSLPPLILTFFEQKFLFWLEVLSLMGEIRLVSQAMVAVKEYIKNPGSKVETFAQDGLAFSRVFGQPIAFSAPHIYLSCVPFAPRTSAVRQQYESLVTKILGIKSGRDDVWPVLQQLFEGHTSGVKTVAFSPDGRRVASGSRDNTVRVWNTETGALLAGPFKGHTGGVNSIAFSPNGLSIASGSEDKCICVWNGETGALVSGPFEGHTGSVNSVAFSPNGQRIVSGSSDRSVRVWDTQTGAFIAGPFIGHIAEVFSATFSPDGRRIASGSRDGSIQICDAETGALTAGPSKENTSDIASIAFSPDGQRIASGSYDWSVRVWNAETCTLRAAPFKGHASYVYSVSFSHNGWYIASGSGDRSARVWDAESGALVAGPFQGHTRDVRAVAFSPDGQYIASGSEDMSVRLWRAESGVLSTTPFEEDTGSMNKAVFSPDGRHIASASGRSLRVWDGETGILTATTFEGHTENIHSIAFSPDGQRIASGSEDHSVRIWDMQTGALTAGPFEGHTSCVSSVVFSTDGRRIISGSWDNTIRLWDAETGALITGPFEGHTSLIHIVAVSLDGHRIASSSLDGSVRLWNTQTGALIVEPFERFATSMVFLPDGQCIASDCENSFRVWDVETGVLVAGPFEGHTDSVGSVSFSPNGQYVASGSDDRSVRIWGAHTGALIAGPFEGYTDPVDSVAFSPDGRRLMSASNRTIRVDDFTRMVASPSPRGTSSKSPDSTSPHDDEDDGFTSDSRLEHGWMRNRKGELLFWVPPEHRAELWSPHRISVISEKSTRLNLEHFVHGEDWAQCYEERRIITIAC
ncbi:hypothetical protein HWV62_32914 [Athelia sp. TMB]|nr:hypothetical protein HWV62_32914 [Athelia sp. TMB]